MANTNPRFFPECHFFFTEKVRNSPFSISISKGERPKRPTHLFSSQRTAPLFSTHAFLVPAGGSFFFSFLLFFFFHFFHFSFFFVFLLQKAPPLIREFTPP